MCPGRLQALSIRTDILPPVYSRALKSLQDNVPAFSTEVAQEIIEQELGLSPGGINSLFPSFPEAPIAAASIGQVYRARFANGTEVAVKVQRPEILETIASDLYLLRAAEPWLSSFPLFQGVGSYVSVIDGWGVGFVEELDYRKEAENSKRFRKAMAERGLATVVAPAVYTSASSGKVVTSVSTNNGMRGPRSGMRKQKWQRARPPRRCSLLSCSWSMGQE